MTDEEAIKAAFEGITSALVQRLLGGLQTWQLSLRKWLKRTARTQLATEFNSLNELSKAVSDGQIRDDNCVRVRCKPSPFGPFLKEHALPVVRPHTAHYLGPLPLSKNPWLNTLNAAMLSLLPVGLFPPPDHDLIQGFLYPADAADCGYISLTPILLPRQVTRIPAIFRNSDQMALGHNCNVRGVVRMVPFALLHQHGCSPETYENIRQTGQTWFLDAATEEGKIEVISDKKLPLWAGLYAAHHPEILDGELQMKVGADAIATAIREHGFQDLRVFTNQVAPFDITLSAKGLRALCHPNGNFFHMDVDVHRDLTGSRTIFDSVCTRSIELLADAAKGKVHLANPNDLDFTYTDADAAHTVMKSIAANAIADPIAVAIRDWNRSRSKAHTTHPPNDRATKE